MRLPRATPHSLPLQSIFLFTLTLSCLLVSFLTLRAAAQQLSCPAQYLRFGSVAIGQSETLVLTLTNSGPSSVTVSEITSTNNEYQVTGVTLPLTIPVGQTNVSVTFTPNTTGPQVGTLQFASDATNPLCNLRVEGGGVNSEVLNASPSGLTFGSVGVGSSVSLPIVLTNNRSWPVVLQASQSSNSEFSVSSPTLPMTLAAGQSVTWNVTFTPTTTGAVGGTILAKGTGLMIPLTGAGVPAAGQLTINPTSTNFGNVTVGQSATQPFTLGASGNPVTVSGASSSSSQFSLQGGAFPVTIPAGQSVTLTASFSPSASGAASGSLTFVSNASNPQVADAVTGMGVAVQHSVQLSWEASPSDVAGYNIYRGTAPGSYSRINANTESATQYTDTNLAAGTYYYAATAVNSSGEESAYSAPVQAVVP